MTHAIQGKEMFVNNFASIESPISARQKASSMSSGTGRAVITDQRIESSETGGVDGVYDRERVWRNAALSVCVQ
jgi:hypothetical protein